MVRNLKNASSKSLREILQGLSRHKRRRVTEALIRAANPGISNGKLKALIRAGIYPKRYGTRQVSRGIQSQLLEAVGAAIGFTGSATGGLINHVRTKKIPSPLAVGVVDSFQTF